MERLKSSRSFVFTALGAAMGLGNALRFPGLCYYYGGAFLVAYAVALAAVGYPLLKAEFSLGQSSRASFPAALATFGRRTRIVGWTACANSALIAVYYVSVISRLCGKAFTFYGQINYRYSADMPWAIPLLAALCWLGLGFMLARSARARSDLARAAVTLQIAMFAVLAARGLLFGNSGQALASVFAVDIAAFADIGMWADALFQTLLSLSVAAGVMPAFAGKMPGSLSARRCAAEVAAVNFLGCLLSSVALLTVVHGCALTDSIGTNAFSNAFVLYPAALSAAFPNGVVSGIFGTLFYFSLTLTAFVSALSLLGAMHAALGEKFALSGRAVSFALCLPCALLSVVPVYFFEAVGAMDFIACSIVAPVVAVCESALFLLRRLLTDGRRSGKIFLWKFLKRSTGN